MKNLITFLLIIIFVVNLASLNQCTSTHHVPKQSNTCSHAGYVHIDTIIVLMALKQAKLDSLVLRHMREVEETENYYESKIDSAYGYFPTACDTLFKEILITRPYGDCELWIHYNGAYHPTAYSESDSIIKIRCFPFTKF